MPSAGVDYPKTRGQFLEWFHSEDACRAYLEHLRGEVEVDESYLALTDRKHPISAKGRQSNTTKAMVAIAVEVVPKGFGRIRIQRLDRGNQQNLQSFIKDNGRTWV
jgi:ISXO2-like transposase domain